MKPKPYPILVETSYRTRPWGDAGLSDVFPLPRSNEPPGEIFLMTPDSLVQNGELEGRTMNDVAALGADFMGRRRTRQGFPFVVKVFGTGKPLALQVHPSNEAVRQDASLRTNHKAWYVLDSSNGAKVFAELKTEYTRQQLLSRLGQDSLREIINCFDLEARDCYYLPSGRVHGIETGARILSVEESNPSTYVVGSGDYHEFDDAVSINEVEAIQRVNFADRTTPRIVRDNTPGESRNRKIPLITMNPAFSLEELRLTAKMHHRTGNQNFHILIPLEAPIEVSVTGCTIQVPTYGACFIPAKTGFYSTVPSAPSSVLRVC